MTDERQTRALPEHLKRYFWDYDADRLTWEASRQTVIRRLLESGEWDAVRWLRARVGDDELREFVVRRRGGGMDPKRLRFWALVLGLPCAQVDRWVAARKTNPWSQRTRG